MLKKNIFLNLNKKAIFFISLVLCFSFYFFEGLLGIDKFYHPDSLFYLDSKNFPPTRYELDQFSLDSYTSSWGYFYYVRLLGYNYELNLIFNFVIHSLTNVIIFEKIFKKFIKKYSLFDLILLSYILFLDPYRLHLTCHILKETILIFILVMYFLSNSKFFKLSLLFILEFFRGFGFIYYFTLFFYKHLLIFLKFLKNLNSTLKRKTFILFLSILIFFIGAIYYLDLNSIFNQLDYWLKHYHYREMPIRDYDSIYKFQDGIFSVNSGNFYYALISKWISWSVLLLTGSFAFFTDSFLFKILGILILINHIIIFKITQKTFIDIGLILLLFAIALWSTSYTAFYRYCYIGIYFSILNFFFTLNSNEK